VYSCLVPAMIAIAASLSILRLCGIWFAPGAIVGTLALCAVLVGIAHLRHWRRQAHRDTLTGLPNRREFTSTLQRELAATARDGDPITLTLVDIDHFKQFNDTAGHARGDRLLVRVARLLEGVLVRPRELAVRLGGDEFALILPEIGVERAREVAQRLQADMRTMTSQFESAGLPMPTLTIGIATRTPGSKTGADELFEQADSALYRAKRRGRDRVIIADESP
jgi:diguanylate cyclase (GGDEF)-like protein